MKISSMIKTITLFAALLVGYTSLNAQNSDITPKIDSKVEHVNRYPSPEITFSNGAIGEGNIIYSQPNGYRPLLMDIYLPPKTLQEKNKNFPLVIYIHGGAWMGGVRQRCGAFHDFPEILASLAAKGYVVASINYRLSSEASFPAPIQDVKTAIKWLRKNAANYKINPDKIATWGASAGGHLSGLAAVSGDVPDLEPVQINSDAVNPDEADKVDFSKYSDKVQAAVCWYGIYDFATMSEQSKKNPNSINHDAEDAAEWILLGGNQKTSEQNGKLKQASPITYVNKQTPPMLLMAGDNDIIVPYYQSQEMGEALKKANNKSKVIIIPGVGHSFIGKTQKETQDAYTKALNETFDFFDKTLK